MVVLSPKSSKSKLPQRHSGAGEPSEVTLGRKWRVVLSVLIVLHILAVTAEPLRFFSRSSRGTSPAADPARELLAPYVEFAYLSHGYFFFAPEPGPSHLIECRFQDSQGQQLSLRYPDRQAQWPRLLYHRHFMLTENLHQIWAPPVDLRVFEEDEALGRQWRADRKRYEQVRDSMANHVAATFGAAEVELDRVEHRLPSGEEVLDRDPPLKLDDPSLYLVLPDAEMPESGAAPVAGAEPGDSLPGAPEQ